MDYIPFCSDIDFMPHGHCYFWQPGILWPHVLGDLLTALAYYLIPIYLVFIIKKRKEEVPGLIFYAFALFIIVCGTAHIFAAISVWYPMYRTEAVLKVLMAIVSLGTVGLVLREHQTILNFPTPFQLKQANIKLQQEIERANDMENKLRRSQQLLNLAMANTPIGMAHVNLEGSFIMVNKALCKMLGYSESELLKIDFQSITHPDDLDKDLRLLEKVLNGDIEEYDIEKRYLHKQGHYVWGWLSVSLLKDEKNKPIHFISQIADVSDRKATENKLRQSEQMFRKVIKNAPIGQSLFDKDFKWLLVNEALCKILGYSEAELLQKKIEDLILPEDKNKGEELMGALMRKEIPKARIEKRHLHKEGHILWIALNASIIWNNNEFQYLLVQWANITPLKNKEKEIIRLNETLEDRVKERTHELQQANKELENFTYILTHDLRQPLKNMSNLAELLNEEYTDKLDDDGKYMLNLLNTNANKVDRLIIDMLSYARSSKTTFKKMPVQLKTLFKEEFEINKLPYGNLPTTLNMDDLPLVLGDEIALRQVCQNLISNALKYSSKKEEILINITTTKKSREAIFSIQDNGIGFDDAHSHKVFEIFQRLHGAVDFEGTGIGMAISAKIIEKHGGKIWVKSVINQGTTFYFTLPLAEIVD